MIWNQDQHKITILSGTAGCGKTKTIMQNLEHLLDKNWYITNSHTLLSDQERKMNDYWLHLYGLKLLCQCFKEKSAHYNQKVASVIRSDFPNECTCQVCKILKAFKQDECSYRLQIKNLADTTTKNVMSPIQYASTGMFKNFGAKNVVVDDCMTQKRDHIKFETLEKNFKILYHLFYNIEPTMGLLEFNKDSRFDEFIKKLEETRDYYLSGEVIAITGRKISKRYPLTLKALSIDVVAMLIIYPDEFKTYKKFYSFYGFKEVFSTPYFYYLFDYFLENEGNVNLTIIDAVPNENFFALLKLRYEFETHKNLNFKFVKHPETFTDQGSVVYSMLPQKDAFFPLASSIDNDKFFKSGKRRTWIGEQIFIMREKFRVEFGRYPILGFITSQLQCERATKTVDFETGIILKSDCEFIRAEWKVKAKHLLWFWNQRGMNTLEECDIVCIVGTPVVNHKDLIEEFKLWFPNLEIPSTKTVEEGRHGGYYHYIDENLESFRIMKEEDELYHAFLRARPHLYKKWILAFCLTLNKIKDDPLLHFDDSFKQKRGDIMVDEKETWLVEYVKQHNGKVPEKMARDEMANKFKINLDSAYRAILRIVINKNILCFEQIGSQKYLALKSK